LTKNQFYISQNALKLIRSQVEFQKIFRGDTPDLCFSGRGSRIAERGKREGEGEGEWGSPTHYFRLKSCTDSSLYLNWKPQE